MTTPGLVPPALVARAFARAGGARWGLGADGFAASLERSVRHAFAAASPVAREVAKYVEGLHLEDLALAAACEAGLDAAWDHFILQHRPGLYRAAAAIDRQGNGRELADSLYAELFGLKERDGERQSLFRYFHGRSSLGSWVRAVLAQRHIDRLRATRRLEPLPDENAPGALSSPSSSPASGESVAGRYHQLMREALTAAITALDPTDRLRIACYYVHNMKLAAIGRMLGEHEASASRHLARARTSIRRAIEVHLRTEAGFDAEEVAACFRTVADDSGNLDLSTMVEAGAEPPGKNRVLDRSEKGRTSGRPA